MERKHKHLLCVCRALKMQAAIPYRFWGRCLLTICYLVNLMPLSILHGRIPLEVLSDNVVALLHLRVFSCVCFSTNLVLHDKMQVRCTPAVMMGYSFIQKGYKFLNLVTGSFKEHIFPFQHNKESLQRFFCVSLYT